MGKHWINRRVSKKQAVLLVIVFAAVACVFTLFGQAATPTSVVSFEPEVATVAVPAVVQSDSLASGGSSVRFAATQSVDLVHAVCGTWALQQVTSASDLNNRKTKIDTALGFSNVQGLSIRVPWNSIEANLTLLDAGKAIAAAHSAEYTTRFMAGRHTPASVFSDGAFYFIIDNPGKLGDGEKAPKPFSDAGVAGNPVFEAAYRDMVRQLVAYSKANNIRLLHLPWYGWLWAEIYAADDVVNAPGYSDAVWVAGHKRLIDIAAEEVAAANADVAIEFANSGHFTGTLSNGTAFNKTGLMTQLNDYVISKFGQNNAKAFIQGNGLGEPSYGWNVPATGKAVFKGMQMFDATSTYDWTRVYNVLDDESVKYVEVYVDSFGATNSALLQTEITQFDLLKCR